MRGDLYPAPAGSGTKGRAGREDGVDHSGEDHEQEHPQDRVGHGARQGSRS